MNGNAGDFTKLADEQLMEHVARGNTQALGELVHRHQQTVRALAQRTVGDAALADDVAQEAFLRVWRSAKRYEPSARFSTWVYRIVVNLCLDARKRRRDLTGQGAEDVEYVVINPAQQLEDSDRSRAVRRAVDALPPRQRLALVLHRFSGLSLAQVAEITDWSESAIESLLVRAYRSLREALKKELEE